MKNLLILILLTTSTISYSGDIRNYTHNFGIGFISERIATECSKELLQYKLINSEYSEYEIVSFRKQKTIFPKKYNKYGFSLWHNQTKTFLTGDISTQTQETNNGYIECHVPKKQKYEYFRIYKVRKKIYSEKY